VKTTKPDLGSLGKLLVVQAALAVAGVLALPSAASAGTASNECSAATLRGVYMFRASGFNIVNGAALPKAIIETLVFHGDGNVTTPAVSLSINGTIVQPPQGNAGIYTVDADCTGTLTFADGPQFDLQIRPKGNVIHMLQTNPNTVMQGTSQKVLSLSDWQG
jgi:hypothetical protein